MGLGSKLKKAAKKTSSAAKKTTVVVNKVSTAASKAKTVASTAKAVGSDLKDVANNPLVQTGLTIGATALGGPAGAQMVNTGYAVMNAEGNILDKALAGASASGVLNIAGAGAVPAASGIEYAQEVVYENPAQVAANIDRSGFSNIAYSASNPAASGAGQLTQSFLKKHKTKIIIGGALGLFATYKLLGGKKKKRR